MTDQFSYVDMTIADLLDAFASNEPLPGGGSACALTGALGVSLLIMVAGLPRTRSGADAPEEAADLAEASARLRPLRGALIALIDRDSASYRQILTAFKLPKGSDAEKAARSGAIQAAMREATDAPLDTMRACQQALAGAVVVARHGYRAASSDAGAGVELLVAALRGSALSIDANLAGIKDATYTARAGEERRQLEVDGLADADRARELLRA